MGRIVRFLASLFAVSALAVASVSPSYAAGLSVREEELYDQFVDVVESYRYAIGSFADQYEGEARSALVSVDLTDQACDEFSSVVSDISDILGQHNIETRADIRSLEPRILSLVNNTGSRYGLSVTLYSDGYAEVTVSGTTSDSTGTGYSSGSSDSSRSSSSSRSSTSSSSSSSTSSSSSSGSSYSQSSNSDTYWSDSDTRESSSSSDGDTTSPSSRRDAGGSTSSPTYGSEDGSGASASGSGSSADVSGGSGTGSVGGTPTGGTSEGGEAGSHQTGGESNVLATTAAGVRQTGFGLWQTFAVVCLCLAVLVGSVIFARKQHLFW